MKQKTIHLHLATIFISLIGNGIAEYSLLWRSVNADTTESITNIFDSDLGIYFIAQALGFAVLSPLLGTLFDRFSRRFASICVDTMYAISFLCCWFVNTYYQLNPFAIFIFSLTFSALGALYRNAVLYSMFKALAKQYDITFIMARFSYIFALVVASSLGLSGFIVGFLGLNQALYLGIVTFLPMPYIYTSVFKKENQLVRQKMLKENLWGSLQKIARTSSIRSSALSVTLANLSASILPGVVSVIVIQEWPDVQPYISLILATLMVLSMTSIPLSTNLVRKYTLRVLMLLSFVPPSICFMIAALTESPIWYLLSFLFGLTGITLSNLTTGAVRVNAVQEAETASVNTMFFAIISSGHIAGAAFIVPMASSSVTWAGIFVSLSYLSASIVGYLTAPNIYIADIKDE